MLLTDESNNYPKTDTEAAVEAGARAAVAEDRLAEWNGLPLVQVGARLGLDKETLAAHEARQAEPPRLRGEATLHDLDSFCAYVTDEAGEEVWLDRNGGRPRLVAVMDASGWRGWRAHHPIDHSPEWAKWLGVAGKPMSQGDFGDLLEERWEDLVEPGDVVGGAKPVDLITMARDLRIHTVGKFQRRIDPVTGTGSLLFETEHGAGSTKIPRAFALALRPWEGGDAYRVEARLRFLLVDGRATFTVTLHRIEEVWLKAWRELAGKLRERLGKGGTKVYIGAPPAEATGL